MPLMPKRTKYRKQQKGRNRGKATRGTKVKWRIRNSNIRSWINNRKSNRSSTYCYDTLHQKRWKSLDKNIPR